MKIEVSSKSRWDEVEKWDVMIRRDDVRRIFRREVLDHLTVLKLVVVKLTNIILMILKALSHEIEQIIK